MLIIGIAGGSGSGKTTVVKKVISKFNKESVAVIAQDAYYFDNGNLSDEEKRRINFDHPSSIEFDLLINHLEHLQKGENIEMPIYSYVTCGRSKETITIEPKEVVIVEGILIFTNKELLDMLDIKVFVDAESDDRLSRIIMRDVKDRNRTYIQAIEHYNDTVKPMHLQFIEPSKRYADIIIPQGGHNKVAIDMLADCVRANLHK
jgi:uridine kinase